MIFIRYLLLIILGASLCSCGKITENHGSFISDREISTVIKGVTTKDDIYLRFGPPVIDDGGFLYLGVVSETGPLTRRRANKCLVTYFQFDSNNVISDIVQYEQDKLYTYRTSQHITDIHSKDDKTFLNFIAGIVHDKSRFKSHNIAKISPSVIK